MNKHFLLKIYLISSPIEFLFPPHELLLLLREGDELIQSLLVDVRVLLQFVVGPFQLLEQLLLRLGFVLAEGVGGERAEFPDLLGALLDLVLVDGLLRRHLLQLLRVLLDLLRDLAFSQPRMERSYNYGFFRFFRLEWTNFPFTYELPALLVPSSASSGRLAISCPDPSTDPSCS